MNSSRDLDPRAVRRAFDDAARHYDAHAALQREVADRLLARLDYTTVAPATVLDLGAGTGYCTGLLERRYAKARFILADIAPSMLATARAGGRRFFSRRSYVCGDASALPLANASIDLIVSSLTLQWCEDLGAVFEECARVLRPGGLLLFSTLGPDTLHELRAAWAAVDAAQTFAAILEEEPENATALAGLARAYIALDQLDQAEAVLNAAAPAIAKAPLLEAVRAQIALARQAAQAGPLADLEAAVMANPADHQARFDYALALHAAGQVQEAVDALLELFRRDRDWNDGAAKAQLFTIFDALKPQDPIALTGRRRLSSLIFA